MQTTDGDTAQVGPGIAEILGLPHASYVNDIQGVEEGNIMVGTDMGDGTEALQIALPCLITVTQAVNQPRLPSFRLKLSTKDKPITIWDHKALKDANPDYFGLDGSPTQVERIFPPPKSGEQEIWQGSALDLALRMEAKLKELKYL